jgi:hypothetical protein
MAKTKSEELFGIAKGADPTSYRDRHDREFNSIELSTVDQIGFLEHMLKPSQANATQLRLAKAHKGLIK